MFRRRRSAALAPVAAASPSPSTGCRVSPWHAAIIAAIVTGFVAWPANAQVPARETLCILDFHRLGDDASVDWLSRGLADMLITTMNRMGPFQIVDRQHLREILLENGLASVGAADVEAGLERARLARAQFLILGNFAVRDNRVTIEARLVRVADQEPVSMVAWEGPRDDVLLAPTALAEDLLTELEAPLLTAPGEGLEAYLPRTIDVAESFYSGMEAFDDGRYPLALGHYLDATSGPGRFLRGDRAVIQLYYLLGRGEHAVLFARDTAEGLERYDLENALSFYFRAAELCRDALDDRAAAISYWRKLVELAAAHELRTGEAAATKKRLTQAVLRLQESGEYDGIREILASPDLRDSIWSYGIEEQAAQIVGPPRYRDVLRDGRWVKERVPGPSVFMWKTRAQLHLARAYVLEGDARTALELYDEILEDYEFLNQRSLVSQGEAPAAARTPVWGRDIELEALFMRLYHYRATGELIRDERRMVVLDAGSPAQFTRDFGDMTPHRLARVWSRRHDGGHEYFDFAAPPGYQIDEVTFRLGVEGVARLAVDLPDARGWPPQYDFSQRLREFTFHGGEHTRRVELPEGTELMSASVLWGPRWLRSPFDLLRYELLGGNREIVAFDVEFSLSPKEASAVSSAAPRRDADRLVIEHFAERLGWDDGRVLRQRDARRYTGVPRRDVLAVDWLVYSQGGDLQVLERDHPEVRVALPVTINSHATEHDPSLIATHEGTWALLWTRGDPGRDRDGGYFVAHSRDLVRWQTPQRLAFAPVEDERPMIRGRRSTERTSDIVATPDGYLMLLPQGFSRFSDDLRRWSTPRKLLPFDGHESGIATTRDGRIWAVGTRYVEQELAPGAPRDPMAGYATRADGTAYQIGEVVLAATSTDGHEWRSTQIHVDRQVSGLWIFSTATDQIGIAASYNNYFLKWFFSDGPSSFTAVESPVRLLLETPAVEFFVRGNDVFCARPVRDFVEEDGVLLLLRSDDVIGGTVPTRVQPGSTAERVADPPAAGLRMPDPRGAGERAADSRGIGRPTESSPGSPPAGGSGDPSAAPGPAPGGQQPARIWVVPFVNATDEPGDDVLGGYVAALLEVLLSRSTRDLVVDREYLDAVMAERDLGVRWPGSPTERLRRARLLGASVMVSGSISGGADRLVVTAHAHDVASGRLIGSVEGRGGAGDITEIVERVHDALVGDLSTILPELRREQIDPSPLSNLRFSRGLSYYYAARYNLAIAELIDASADPGLEQLARLWIANSYLALAAYGHAWIELKRLQASPGFRPEEVARKLRLCEQQLSDEELIALDNLVSAVPRRHAGELSSVPDP